jgi:hypothetical protein
VILKGRLWFLGLVNSTDEESLPEHDNHGHPESTHNHHSGDDDSSLLNALFFSHIVHVPFESMFHHVLWVLLVMFVMVFFIVITSSEWHWKSFVVG